MMNTKQDNSIIQCFKQVPQKLLKAMMTASFFIVAAAP